MPAIEARPRGGGKTPKSRAVMECPKSFGDACEVALFSRVIDGTILARV